MHSAEKRYSTSTASSLVQETISAGIRRLLASQQRDGAFTDCFDTGVMSDAQTVISLFLLGVKDSDWTDPLLRRIERKQRSDGVWEVYPGGGGDLSTTVECYYALELHGRWQQASRLESAATKFIKNHGGLKNCRNLTKVFLAAAGEVPWSWLPSPKIYSWLFADHTPIRLSQLVMFTRLHVPPMLVLSSLRYISKAVKSPVLQHLVMKNKSVVAYRRPFGREHARLALLKRMGSSRRTERIHTVNTTQSRGKRFNKCISFMLNERESDGTLAGYHSATFLLLLSLRALQYSEKDGMFTVTLDSMKKNLYMHDDEAGHQQTCNSYIWNTAIAVQALETAGTGDIPPVRLGVEYLLAKQQVTANMQGITAGDRRFALPALAGAWGFSSNNHKHPDTDDTVSCLEALYPFRKDYKGAWQQGVQWLLAMQNNDGGWSAFERNSGKKWLEWIPANDMKRSMSDPSTSDITGRVLEFILRRAGMPRSHPVVVRALDWLMRHQNSNGSWFGRWGTPYTYGTWCAVRALSAARVSSSGAAMEKAKEWVVAHQRLDGGFGESCASDVEGRYVPTFESISTQTAWGLDTIIHLLKQETQPNQRKRLYEAADRAARWLLYSARDGTWEESFPTGSAFPGSLHIHYEIYPKVWPLMALCRYQDVLRTEGR
ncbi:prenyltransferase/squalene oxidase repeat-containing protein [Alicyclobacillus sp. SO9]|uniref:prenyltransferase/squalene oxidase repeat-containing protein n=1 Tax=Alicyclobacillus sp. SO9 TaxID=2665646 RepID=UPI0018E7DF45|nr:prenyltransferase/squalene oxidase repeat-containing protein [Alicyclobacillus sp. SO9]QQE81017.1 hypothetical protein GI364_11930 [Alicyclobacillus sp. SO9]